ncbi:MAG: histidine phosphatase family protein [Gordonia sp. (in: high G+C Gram-positive bacteria)]
MTLLFVAGRTAPNRSVRFGGEHDPLDARGRTDVAKLAHHLPRGAALVSGPELSVRQSAEILCVAFDVAPELATLDVGCWTGVAPEDLDPAELGGWFADPSSCPHGGESVVAFLARITSSIRLIDDDAALLVAKPVAQALLCPVAARFFATDVRPASVHPRPA